MNRCLYFLVAVFSTSLIFSQQVELKRWTFNSELDSQKQQVEIPHTWNKLDAFDDEAGYWRGKGFYNTKITISNTKKTYFLHFNGVNQHTKVWVNNTLAGEHKGGYTAFDINITKCLKSGENTIAVQVDNTHNETIPPLDADFTFYGGIYREVFLCEENSAYFEKKHGADAIKIDPFLDENWQGKLEINGSVFCVDKNQENYKVQFILRDTNNKIITTLKKTIDPIFNIIFSLKDPLLWSPQSPNLYSIELNLLDRNGNILDVYKHKVGFRKFEANTSGFYLNGKLLKLIGVNRHQDFEGYGNAVPIQKQIEDLILIKNMGSNFLRLAHYPQGEAIYKAADSLGLILWSEIPVINKVPIDSSYFEYKENAVQMQKEHIYQNYNHPSLVFIGYMNEIFIRLIFDKPDVEAQKEIVKKTMELSKTLENLTRIEAPNHITVMALHGNQIYNDSGIANIPMVIGWNLYYGWYEGQSQDLGRFLDDENLKFPKRPLIISEYGVGADQRLHNSNPKKFDFSEEYQFDYHPAYYEQVKKRPFVIGMAAWNFADFGSEFRGDAIPHVNQKGLVNFNRSPKNIYYWYKAILKPEEKQSRFFKELETHLSESPQKKIIIVSNEKVFFKLNSNESVKLEPNNGLIKHSITLEEGSNILLLHNERNQLQDSIRIKCVKPNLEKCDSLAISFGTENYFIDDTNQIWIPYQQQSILKISGNAKNVSSSANIKNTLNDPIYQSSVHNVEKIRIELPKGIYTITLLFSELQANKASVYELNKKNEDNSIKNSNQNLLINGEIINVEKLNSFSKTEITLTIAVQNQLIIVPADESQKISICGIKINKN